MRIRQLVTQWQNTIKEGSPKVRLHIEVPVQDAARLAALADLFPSMKHDDVIAELLHTALDEVQEAFPYVKGKPVGEDEVGNPIYADDGYTPRFLALVKEHLARFKS